MKVVAVFAATAIIAATSAAFAKMVACDSAGHYEEKTTNIYGKPITITRGIAFDWAVRQQRSFVDDARDPIWQHAWCDTRRHIVIWCFPGGDEEKPECQRAASSSGAGTMRCAEVNRPHDPARVRAWLRGYLTGANYYGDYQDVATAIGTICQSHPSWLLESAARHWVERAR